MTFRDELSRLQRLVEDFASENEARILELQSRADRLLQAAQKIAPSWNGSALESYYDLYFGDFEIPPGSHRINPVTVALGRGEMPPGWRRRTVEEIGARIEGIAGESIDKVQAETSALRDEVNGLREELLNGLAPLRKMKGVEDEVAQLTRLDGLDLEKKAAVYADKQRPKQHVGTIYEMGQNAVLPHHLYFESLAYEARSRTTSALEFMKLNRRLLRQLDANFSPTAKTLGSEEGFVVGEKIFIGHGHSNVWKDLRDFLERRLGLSCDDFEAVATAGIPHAERLGEMLDNAAFAFLVLTGEDETGDGRLTARANVIHEVGLFQGRLGFRRAIVLLEEGCEEFSNIAGLGQIRFPTGDVMAKSEEIRRVLERDELVEMG